MEFNENSMQMSPDSNRSHCMLKTIMVNLNEITCIN